MSTSIFMPISCFHFQASFSSLGTSNIHAMSSQQSGMDAVAAFLASTQALSAGTGGLGQHSSRGRPPSRPRAPVHPPSTTSSQSAPASQQFSQPQVRTSAAPQPPHSNSNRKPLSSQVALSSAAGGEAPRHPVSSPHAPTPITRTTGKLAILFGSDTLVRATSVHFRHPGG